MKVAEDVRRSRAGVRAIQTGRRLRGTAERRLAPEGSALDDAQRRLNPLQHYASKGIASVDGWLGHDVVLPLIELSKQQRRDSISGGAAEIGIHHGQLFILLALMTEGDERSVGIDLFEDQANNIDNSGLGSRDALEQNMARALVDRSRVDLIQGNSMDLTAAEIVSAAARPVRLFSVDGGHTPELTTNDLHLAEQSLAPGGIVILDDAFSPVWPGVIQGLITFLDEETALTPFGLIGNKTLLCDRSSAATYRSVLAKFEGHFIYREDSLFGANVTILQAPN